MSEMLKKSADALFARSMPENDVELLCQHIIDNAAKKMMAPLKNIWVAAEKCCGKPEMDAIHDEFFEEPIILTKNESVNNNCEINAKLTVHGYKTATLSVCIKNTTFKTLYQLSEIFMCPTGGVDCQTSVWARLLCAKGHGTDETLVGLKRAISFERELGNVVDKFKTTLDERVGMTLKGSISSRCKKATQLFPKTQPPVDANLLAQTSLALDRLRDSVVFLADTAELVSKAKLVFGIFQDRELNELFNNENEFCITSDHPQIDINFTVSRLKDKTVYDMLFFSLTRHGEMSFHESGSTRDMPLRAGINALFNNRHFPADIAKVLPAELDGIASRALRAAKKARSTIRSICIDTLQQKAHNS